MYDFIDRPVTELDRGGRLLLWSMRVWVKSMGERECPGSALGPVFARANLLAGLQPFLRAMATFNGSGLETFRFCSLACNHVSEHEAIILSLVCALRDRPPQTVGDTLALLVEEDALGNLLDALTTLGTALDAAAIFPAPPCGPTVPASRKDDPSL